MIRKIFVFSVLILISFVCFKFFYNSSFSGTKEIIFLKNQDEISSLDGLINQPLFKDKILYIDLYNIYCSHSLNEFEYFPRIEENLKSKGDVVFVHLATPKWTFSGNWKSTIKKYQIHGYHILMNNEFYEEFWSNFPDEKYRYTPFYISVDKDKKISKVFSPSVLVKKNKHEKIINERLLRIYKYALSNLNSIAGQWENNTIQVSINLDEKSSINEVTYILFSSNSFQNESKELQKQIQVSESFDSFIKETFQLGLKNSGIDNLRFSIPLNSKALEKEIEAKGKQLSNVF